ncbi:MAG: hypothetical protein MUC91_14835, partial [Verrucomicrobia bacterium]|nr:hypothetical protein [Verrucomicrobiota bacterium]
TEAIPPPVLPTRVVVINPLDWLRRFVAANPLYLASVLVLLYGIYRVSADTGFLRLEVQQLFFNFTALQLYEIALVGLAMFLARRLVWYDSTLLVLLENLVIIVPFILVTQASLIDPTWIWGFCAAGIGLATARVGALKRFLRELNLPGQLLAAGGVLLLANAVLPILYRHLQEERMAKTITWGPAYEMNEWSWLVLLPVLVACANLLPAPRATGPLWPQRRWLPSALLASWLVASGVHLYALSYVYTFEMRAALWAPVLVVLAWTIQRRAGDFLDPAARRRRIALLALPFPAALVALGSEDVGVACALAALNTGCYGYQAMQGKHPKWTGQLALASGVATGALLLSILQLPGVGLIPAIVVYVLLASLFSHRPEMGLLGAVGVGAGLSALIPASQGGVHRRRRGCGSCMPSFGRQPADRCGRSQALALGWHSPGWPCSGCSSCIRLGRSQSPPSSCPSAPQR